jgi:indolepyruvate ferredoxin oxidoreductase
MPPGGLHIRWPDPPLEQEARLMDYKWYAALAYVRANKLNHNVIEGPNDRFGIIASGKAYNDTRQALADLGLDEDTCRQLGIRLHKVNVVWPLEATITRDFARACRRSWWSRKSARSSNTSSRKSCTTGATTCAPTCWASSTTSDWRRMVAAQPQPELAAAPKADLTPAIIARPLPSA